MLILIDVIIVYLINMIILFSETLEQSGIDLPVIEIRFNMLLVIGIMILGLILLITLKIYQMESLREGNKTESNG